jgi:ABC-type Zn uptake system ZnuABC Zn-binding protein ZnuA
MQMLKMKNKLRFLVTALALFITYAEVNAQHRICATVPDLGDLAHEIGGDKVEVITFVKGSEDPHFITPRPSFIKDLARAEVFIQNGLEQEVGWAPPLLQSSRNKKVQPGGSGYIDASQVINPLEVPKGPISRSEGDVHPGGNPHYLLSPINGLKTARYLKTHFSYLWPKDKKYFEQRYDDFASRFGKMLIGGTLAAKYQDIQLDQLMLLKHQGMLSAYLKQEGELDSLGGLLALVEPYRGTKLIDDHPMWVYFSKDFEFKVIGHLEPKPGLQPTPSHVAKVIKQVRTEGVKAVLANAYYDPRHARFVEMNTDAKVAKMSHQVGAREFAKSYLEMCEYNVREIVRVLEND